jgi:hypothetical protein
MTMSETTINWQPFASQPADDSPRYWAHHAWSLAVDWLEDFGIGFSTPDSFERVASDRWRFRIGGPAASIELLVDVSYDADSDGERFHDTSYATRVEVTRG